MFHAHLCASSKQTVPPLPPIAAAARERGDARAERDQRDRPPERPARPERGDALGGALQRAEVKQGRENQRALEVEEGQTVRGRGRVREPHGEA
jgi:hypothetical protein